MARHPFTPLRALLVAAALALLALPGAPARAQSEEAVATARADLERARAEQRRVDATAETTSSRLEAALRKALDLDEKIRSLTLEIAELDEAARAAEAELRATKQNAADRARDAYMTTVGTTWAGPPLATASLNDALIAGALIDIAIARGTPISAPDRRRIDAARADLEVRRAEIVALERRSEDIVADLEALLGELTAQASLASRDVAAAAENLVAQQAALEAALAGLPPAVTRWRAQVVDAFGQERSWEALRVMACESGGRPDAVNSISGASGLFQFLPTTWVVAAAMAGHPDADPFDPEANIAAAAWLVRHSVTIDHPGGAWGHWECQP